MRLHPATIWGIGGWLVLLSQAIYRLTPLAYEAIESGEIYGWRWGLLAGWTAFMLYSEGYKGFWLQASPRVVARGFHLARDPSPVRRLLAPLFCMGLFGATRRRLIVSWCLYAGLVVVIIAVRQVPQPWRGVIDFGVVAGLGLGVLAVIYYTGQALAGRPMPVPAEVPDEHEQDD